MICSICKEKIEGKDDGGAYMLSNKLFNLHFKCYRDSQDLLEKLRKEERENPNPNLLLD